MAIFYNNSYINEWYYNSAITKVYYNDDVVYQKLTSGSTPPSPSGLTILSPEYVTRDSNNTGYIPLAEYFTSDIVIDIDFQMMYAQGYCVVGDYYDAPSDSSVRFFLGAYNTSNKIVMYDVVPKSRIQKNLASNYTRNHWEVGNFYIKDLNNDTMIVSGTSKTISERPNQLFLFHMELSQAISQQNTDYGNVYSLKIKKGGVLVKDFIPWTDGNGNYGFFDKVSCTVFPSTGQMSGSTTVNQVQVSCPQT